MTIRVFTDLLISADTTTDPYAVAGRVNYSQQWIWKFELDSGTGSNQLKIKAQQAADWDTTDASLTLVDVQDTTVLNMPSLVTSEWIDEQTNDILLLPFENKGGLAKVIFDFDISGGGSRVFKVNLFINE